MALLLCYAWVNVCCCLLCHGFVSVSLSKRLQVYVRLSQISVHCHQMAKGRWYPRWYPRWQLTAETSCCIQLAVSIGLCSQCLFDGARLLCLKNEKSFWFLFELTMSLCCWSVASLSLVSGMTLVGGCIFDSCWQAFVRRKVNSMTLHVLNAYDGHFDFDLNIIDCALNCDNGHPLTWFCVVWDLARASLKLSPVAVAHSLHHG